MPTSKYGVFSEPGYLCTGDPYVERDIFASRTKGVNFKASKVKTGKLNDSMFTRFEYAYDGYGKDTKASLEEIKARKAKQPSEAPFKGSSPTKKGSGYYGTIGQRWEYMPEGEGEKMKKGDAKSELPNIKTSPSKKGTYGVAKLTLSESAAAGGLVGEYSYASEPYTINKLDPEGRAAAASKLVAGPFKPSNPPKLGPPGVPKVTIGGLPRGIVGEYAYVEHGIASKPPAHHIEKPFCPPKPPRQGYNSTINKFPEHVRPRTLSLIAVFVCQLNPRAVPVQVSDPMEIKEAALKAEREARKAALEGHPGMVPAGIAKKGATPSVMKMNISRTGNLPSPTKSPTKPSHPGLGW